MIQIIDEIVSRHLIPAEKYIYEFFDPLKCRVQCAEFGRSALGMDARLCGICVAACPVGKKKTVR